MNVTAANNDEQVKIWNGPAGQAWVEAQQTLDRMFEPFQAILVEEARAAGARHVLDVGCGTGSTTMAIAGATGAHAVGVDLSEPMIALARARAQREASRAEFLVADAQSHAFVAEHYDLIVSRFGVMFFADPARAFANLLQAARPGAHLRCIVFRAVGENPFMTAAERAAAPLLPQLPARDPDAPGQFAFADPGRVRGFLAAGGWSGAELQPLDVTCVMPVSALDGYLSRLGPVGLALRSADEALRTRVATAVRAAFTPWIQGDEVRFQAACWKVCATRI